MNGVIFPYVIPFFLHVDTVNLTIYASRVGLLGQTKAGILADGSVVTCGDPRHELSNKVPRNVLRLWNGLEHLGAVAGVASAIRCSMMFHIIEDNPGDLENLEAKL